MKSFEEYHKENPEVWKAFLNTTLNTINRGFENYSAKGIFEIIRWHRGGETKSDGFKVNNNYTADYARMFARLFPKHKDFFRTRKIKQRLMH